MQKSTTEHEYKYANLLIELRDNYRHVRTMKALDANDKVAKIF